MKYPKFRGDARSGKRLARGQVKQVQRIIEKNKRLKNTYVPLEAYLASSPSGLGATGAWVRELTEINQFNNSVSRSEDQILLKSYNIKLGSTMVQGATGPLGGDYHSFAPFRVIIARSKIGQVFDITDPTNASILDFTSQPDPDRFQVYTDEIHNMYGNSAFGTTQTDIPSAGGANGYLLHMYKSFKNKKVPHMIVGYDETATPNEDLAVSNGILMKVIGEPRSYSTADKTFLHGFQGFCHLKYFDKE